MSLPPSALLGRLQAFLPELEQANRATEKLAEEGKLEALDTNLAVADTDQQREEEESEGTDDGEEDEDETEGAGGGEEGAEGVSPPKTIQLDFALGDFDDTPIAQMEQENEEAKAEKGPGKEAEAAGMDDAGGKESCVAKLLRLSETATDGAKPRQKPRKPLIEELAEAEKGPGKEAGEAAGMDDADDKASRVAKLLRLSETATDGAKPRQKPRKPLIEEL